MADPTGLSDILPSEWYEVSGLAIYPPSSRPQELVFSYAAHKSGLCRFRGDPFLPERPRIINLRFTRLRHRISVQAHHGDFVGYATSPRNYTKLPPLSFPRSVEPSGSIPSPRLV